MRGFVEIGQDITDRKRAEEALAQERILLRTVIDNLPDAIYIKDAATRKVLANRTDLANIGKPEAEVLGKTDWDVFPAEIASRFYADDQAVLQSGQAVINREELLVNVSGQSRWLLTSKLPLRDKEGCITGIVGIGHDITDRKRAEEKIEHLNLVLRAIRNVNQLITRERDRDRLIQGACKTLIETRGYHSAWIALLDESEGLVATAEAGLGEDFLPLVEHLKCGELTDCVQRALKQSGSVVTEDPSSACADCPLSSMYDGRGAVTIRLGYGGKVYGLLSVSLPRDLAADEEERALFEEVAGDIAFALHNIELEKEAQRRAAQAALVYEVGQRVSRKLELDELLPEIVTTVRDAFDYYGVMILLVDEEANRLTMQSIAGAYAGIFPRDLSHAIGEGMTGYAAASGKTQISADVSQDPHYVREADEKTKSELAVPIKSGQKVIGVLDIQSDQFEAFDETEVMLMETLADQIAGAIENARLFDETHSRAERLAVVNRIAKAASATLHLDDLMETVYREIASIFQGDAFFIALYDEETDELDFCFLMDEGARKYPGRIPLNGLTSLVVTEKKPLVIRDLEQERDRLPAPVLVGGNKLPASWLGAPLMVGGRVIGVINVQSYRPHAWGEEDELLLLTIADQVAVALENARLFEETRTRAEELTTLNEMGRALTAMLDVDAVIESLYHHASRLIDTTHFYVALYDAEQDMVSFPLYVEEGQPIRQEPFRGSKGLSGYVIRTREPLLIEENVAARVKELGIEAIRLESLSWLGVPMTIGGEMIGMISAHSHTTPRLYNERHRDLLTAIANQAAIAIQNARLFEQTEAALEALRVSEERFALAVQGANDGIWDWDIKNNTLYWSPRMKELLGYADDEFDIDFDTFDSLLHPDDRVRTGAAIEAHLKDRGLYNVEQRLRTKSSEYRWFSARGQSLWDEAGNPVRMVGSSSDITERKAAEEALKEYSERLEEMVEERTQELRDAQEALIRQEKLAVLGQLAGGVGHELRNPLAAISNAAYFLNMVLENPEPEVKETLEILQKEVRTSERIISSLLDFARTKPPTRRKVDINEVVQEALSRIAVPENVEVVSQLDEGLPIILADPDQLGQVFGNIIFNAVQAMPQGGQLVVKTSEVSEKLPKSEWVAVSFTDTGVGISEESLGKIFEPLFTTKAKGIGLGLAVTRTLVEGHGGTIEVESQVGKGTTFRVRLPISVG